MSIQVTRKEQRQIAYYKGRRDYEKVKEIIESIEKLQKERTK
jgi:hypothetical protein